jgi:hypothetical protein
MTTRLPVSSLQNKWSDAQKVDLSDMTTEQVSVNNTDAAIVQNFFGSGVILDAPTPNVIFDTAPDKLTAIETALIAAMNFDGTGLTPQNQPSDTQEGIQLAVELADSAVFGRGAVKVLIIGLSFDGELQYDRFEFHKNETQTTNKHYTNVLTIIFNNFLGNNNCSCTMGGHIIIREVRPFELNRDAKMVAQDIMPDIFIRDLRPADCHKDIFTVIQDGIGSAYDANDLEINITGKQPSRTILSGDVTTRIGQKFLASSDNIQKITLLLGVSRDVDAALINRFDWQGDIIVSVHALQSTVDNSTDIIPELTIDFEPEDVPIVELSFSQADLKAAGYVLTDIAQPVDFVFANTSISDPGGVTSGRYYVITLHRSGAANLGDIWAEVGTDKLENSRLTMFNGIWVDVVEEDLWFQVWSDTAKYASGAAYDRGSGITSEKTGIDPTTGGAIDNYIRNLSFMSTGSGVVNTGVIAATLNESVTAQDERTGNNVFSRQQYIPSFSFVSNDTLLTLRQTTEPLIIGCMSDLNPKETDLISGTTEYPGMALGDTFRILNPAADLLSLNLIGRKLIPYTDCGNIDYRIMNVTLCTDGYGDVDGDGYITQDDVTAAAALIGEGLLSPLTQQKIIDGYIDIFALMRADVDGDGYIWGDDVQLIQDYVDRVSNSFPAGTSFTHLSLQVQTSVGRWDGYHNCCAYIYLDGPRTTCPSDQLVDPDSLTQAEREYYGNHGVIPDILADNSVFSQVPFLPVDFEIEYQEFWQDWLLALSANSRKMPCSFTYPTSLSSTTCAAPQTFECTERGNTAPACDPGRNDWYVAGNLIIDNGGQIIRPDGSSVKADIEVGIINLELPAEPFSESSIDIFGSFVADRGDLYTNAGFDAMRYSDCTTVQPEDLGDNKVRFNVSIQSFFPNLDGYTDDDGYGIIVDDIIGVYMNHASGILKLTLKDLDYNPLYLTLVTKIQVVVYLKKAGWNNQVLTVTPDQVSNLAVSTP